MRKSQQKLLLKQPIDMASLILDGDRIRLHAIKARFSKDIFKEFTEEISNYMVPTAPQSIADTQKFIRESEKGIKRQTEIVFCVTRKGSEEFLGCCGIHSSVSPQTPTMGIWIKKSAHGNKYGLEAVTLACKWAKENIYFEFLIYPVDRRNRASRSIPEILGGKIFEEKRVITEKGTVLDEFIYKITKETLPDHLIYPK